jgi:hypothetical protein
MKSTVATIIVPDVLGTDPQSVDALYARLANLPDALSYSFDMQHVTFVKPYGTLALVLAARHLQQSSGHPVSLTNLNDTVHHYLDRMDLFRIAGQWLEATTALTDAWVRLPQTPNLLELTRISGPDGVEAVIERTEIIFKRWLHLPDLRNLLRVLSELCANVYQHSGDTHGCALIQKYESLTQGHVQVCLAVGDLGCGIRASLARRHGRIGPRTADYLLAALEGKTSRRTGRGGLGLRWVENTANREGGWFWLRSEDAAAFSKANAKRQLYPTMSFVPGTQVAVTFHAPLPI